MVDDWSHLKDNISALLIRPEWKSRPVIVLALYVLAPDEAIAEVDICTLTKLTWTRLKNGYIIRACEPISNHAYSPIFFALMVIQKLPLP